MMIFPDHLPAGERVQEPVSLRDIPATILDLIGFPGISPFPGSSLVHYLDSSGNISAGDQEAILAEVSQTSWRPSYYPSYAGNMKSIEFDGLRYILSGDGSEELYDFNLDPQELHDLASTPEGQAALPEYRRLLEKLLTQTSTQ